MRIFNFTADTQRTPPPSWATKVADGALRLLFGDKSPQALDDMVGVGTITGTFDDYSNMTQMPTMWRIHQDRKNMHQDIERMDSEDELVSTALDVIAEMATNFSQDNDNDDSFRVTAKNKQIQKIIDDLIQRAHLHTEAYQIVRNFVKHGSYLPEVLLDRRTNQIVRIKQTITYQIYPLLTEKGDKLPGWITLSDKDVYNNSGGEEIEEWQICPFIFGAKKGYLSTPMLASARRNWQRLSFMEDSMAVARLIRAYDKYVHRVPIKKEWTVEEVKNAVRIYKDNMTKRKIVTSEGNIMRNDQPNDVRTDYYLPDVGDGTGGISVLGSANTQLMNLNDMYYAREKLLARLRVPISYLQIMSTMKTHIKAGVSSGADLQFAQFMRVVGMCFRSGLARLFDTELLLQGIPPAADNYIIELAKITTKDPLEDAKVAMTQAQTAIYLVEAFGALPADFLAAITLDLDPETQIIFNKYLGKYAEKIMDAQVKAIELTGEPPQPGIKTGGPKVGANANTGAGSGNGGGNKSKAKTKSEQKPGVAKQDVDPEDMLMIDEDKVVDLIVQVQQQAIDAMQKAGFPAPDFEIRSEGDIRRELRQSMIINALPGFKHLD